MAISQAVVFFDGISFRAEMPGPNGSRQKIDLPNFEKRNSELCSMLREQHATQARNEKELARAKAQAESASRQRSVEIENAAESLKSHNMARARLEREAARIERIVSVEERDRNRQRLADQLQDNYDKALLGAKQIWWDIAKTHGIELANRVIDDHTRRPRKVVITSRGAKVKPGKDLTDALIFDV